MTIQKQMSQLDAHISEKLIMTMRGSCKFTDLPLKIEELIKDKMDELNAQSFQDKVRQFNDEFEAIAGVLGQFKKVDGRRKGKYSQVVFLIRKKDEKCFCFTTKEVLSPNFIEKIHA